MSTFLTVKEAAQRIGKSPSAVRRILEPIRKDDQHSDRHLVQPSPEHARELRLKGEIFAWRVSEELLDRVLAAKPADNTFARQQSVGAVTGGSSVHELVAVLRQQLEQTQQQLKVKDEQIATLSEITKSLNERVREGNILIGSLQQKLALTDGAPRPKSERVEQPTKLAKATEPKSTAPTRKPKAKRGLWARLFR